MKKYQKEHGRTPRIDGVWPEGANGPCYLVCAPGGVVYQYHFGSDRLLRLSDEKAKKVTSRMAG